MQSLRREGESSTSYFLRNVSYAAFSACVAETITIPVDTAKVRLQVQKVAEGETPRYKGLVNTMKVVAAEEGPLSLWGGLSAGLQRQVIFAGLRVGLYVPIRDAITGPLEEGQFPSLPQKIMTAFLTGFIAITVANPTDLVKVKLQSQGVSKIQGIPPKYSGSVDCYRQLLKEGGVKNLWTGYGPNVARNSVINSAEVASYDQFKQMMLQYKIMKDGMPCHLTCASMAGFVATVIGSPLDVLKTRIMNAPSGKYKGPLDCIGQTFKNEGFGAFYKGFVPNVIRMSGWNCCMFITLEQVKKHFA